MSIVYILTNEAMPNCVKIGTTDNLSKRLKQLYNTSVPFPFECFFAGQVEDSAKVERRLHTAFSKYRIQKNREFFDISPESIYAILELLTLKDVTPKDIILDKTEDISEIKRSIEKSSKRRSAFNFKLANIPIGSELCFSRDHNIKAIVESNNTIKFNDKSTSLSLAAQQLLGYKYSVSGPLYWMYDDESLDERRTRIELEGLNHLENAA